MNLTSLQTFLAIVETGSLIRASERLNVTQSTVTARLQSLEDHLGQTLVTRHKTGATLTASGLKLQRYAQTMIELWRQARQETSLPQGVEAVCNIGCHVDLQASLGQKLLNLIRNSAPNVAISAWSGSSGDLAGWQENGLVDLALTFETATQGGLRLHSLQPEILTLVSTNPNAPMRFDPSYIFVEGGEEFGRDHAAFYADADVARLSFGSTDWALDHLLANGGSAYLPHARVADHIIKGTLFPINGAPEFSRKTYLTVNEKAAASWMWLPQIIDQLKG